MPTYNRALSKYIEDHFAQEDEVLSQIRRRLASKGLPTYTINPEEGRFLQLLVAACGAKRALELGTLGGYSGIWIARGLPEGGSLITVEQYTHHALLAQEHFEMAGLQDKIQIRQGDARKVIRELDPEGPFDFIFMDADNANLPAYLDWTLDHIRPGGMIAAHNAFVHGAILNEHNRGAYVEGTRVFNRRISRDSRFIATIFPAGDGMTVALRMRE
jgi:caffeoyl-CoA O-methyltransferase